MSFDPARNPVGVEVCTGGLTCGEIPPEAVFEYAYYEKTGKPMYSRRTESELKGIASHIKSCEECNRLHGNAKEELGTEITWLGCEPAETEEGAKN